MEYKKTLNMPKSGFPMRAGLPKREPEMLRYWEELDLYNELLKKNEGKPLFSLHDGPPFSNGALHMGHALNKALKDFINRSYAMRGYYTPYIPGWDNHGMPIESAIIKQNKLNHKAMSVADFRTACHQFADHYIDVQREGFKRMGVVADWDHPYKTMDPGFEAREVRVFGKMYKNGHIYKGLKPVYWCPHDETALAEAEIEYQDDPCTTVYVKFPMNDDLGKLSHLDKSKLSFVICSHTSTHGALGAVAFGVGTSEVEMVLASQCILQSKPRAMRITVDGTLPSGTEAKDIILHIIARITASGGTDHFIEFAGEAIRSLSMEGRMTVCNMSIECGARGGMIAPDQTTFDYLRGRERAPQGEAFDAAVARWRELYSDADARFDREYRFDAAEIAPMITYGTNPGMGMAVDAAIPADADPKALEYMGFDAGERLLGKPVDYVFVGSCTNGRIEDLRRFARLVEGRRKAPEVTAWIVPGSKAVEAAAKAEGLDRILAAAGFELRQPGCSACLAMNADKIPAGKYCVSTSNRNFEGRQGPGARTLLSGVAVAAAAAVSGRIADPRELFGFPPDD